MTWNHRVCKKTEGTDVLFGFHEAYYNKAGEVAAITAEPIRIFSESVEDLQIILDRLAIAMSKPVLDMDTIVYAEGGV